MVLSFTTGLCAGAALAVSSKLVYNFVAKQLGWAKAKVATTTAAVVTAEVGKVVDDVKKSV